MDMQIKCSYANLKDIDLLVPHPKNPNHHSDKQLKLLAKIMKYQGWRSPVIISKRSGFIVAGHGRLEAARINGWTQIPVDEQDFENEAEEFSHLVADNKIAELAEHDDNMMITHLKEIEIEDFDYLGIPNFEMSLLPEINDLDDKQKHESEKKYLIEVEFGNDMDMMDLHDDLCSKGYMVKIK